MPRNPSVDKILAVSADNIGKVSTVDLYLRRIAFYPPNVAITNRLAQLYYASGVVGKSPMQHYNVSMTGHITVIYMYFLG
jgi:hypothetical protein